MLVERVRGNNQGLRHKQFKGSQAIEAFKDPFSLCLFLLCLFNTVCVGGVSTFGPLLVTKAFGFSTVEAQLLNLPIGVISILSYLLVGYLVKRTRQACLCMVGFTVPNIVGTIVLLTVAPTQRTKGGLLVAYYLMQLFGAVSVIRMIS